MNRKYLLSLIITTLLTGAALFSWNYFMPKHSNNHVWIILAYYTLVTAVIHHWLVSNIEPKKFVMRFMGITGIKLMLNLVVILVYGVLMRDKVVSFALMFMIIYFIYTFFESAQLIKSFNQNKERTE